jgi:hypothetical protein
MMASERAAGILKIRSTVQALRASDMNYCTFSRIDRPAGPQAASLSPI